LESKSGLVRRFKGKDERPEISACFLPRGFEIFFYDGDFDSESCDEDEIAPVISSMHIPVI
jgi:hypothetical protein